MPEQGAGAGAARQAEPQQSMMKTVVQGIGIFILTQFVIGKFTGSKTASADVAPAAGKVAMPAWADRPERSTIANYSMIPQFIAPIWSTNSSLDITIQVSASNKIPQLSGAPKDSLVLEEKDFLIGNFSDSREIATELVVPKEVQNNGTLWAYFYVALHGHELDPYAPGYSLETATHFRRPLNQFLPKKKEVKLKSLLGSAEGESDEPVVEESKNTPKATIASYYHPNFTVSLVPDTGLANFRNLHPAIRSNYLLESTGARDASGQNGWYYPVFFVNKFWQLKSQMTELNSTVETVPLRITLNNMKYWQFSLYGSIDDNVKTNQRNAAMGGPTSGGGDGTEFEVFKEILLNTNIYLLGTTFVVTILHMIFETLAFKSDIAHWRKKKDVVGTSVRTILANVFMQAVIFLYLMDNNENTSWMILASQGFGILLEFWKITKTVDVRLQPPQAGSYFSFLPYVIVFEDKHKLSETEQKTKEYDEIAFKYLYIIAVPLLGAYAVYSLMYETHKSWYSFIIATLVGSVYAYGFLMMIPSLYINYRLKSVAHMPAKALTYKFLNTFIDDLFAFTIKMPTLHRLATLRDDVIFFVWLYQSYKYKVDHTRVNEFGQGGDSDDEGDAEPSATKAIEAEADAKQETAAAVASGSAKPKPAKKRK